MSEMKIAVLISGGGSNLQAIIDNVEKGYIPAKVSLVVSNKERVYGLTRAKNHGIETKVMTRAEYTSTENRDMALLKLLKEKEIDLVVLAGYLAILPIEIIKVYRNRIINIHPSLIPSFCGDGFYGERVHEQAFKRGVRVSGATVHFVNEITDGGPIILQETVDVNFNDNVKKIQEKVLKIEHKILPLAVKLFAEGRLEVIDNRVKIHEKQ